MSKQAALDKIIALANEHNITADEIGVLLLKNTLDDKTGSWLSNLMAYIGGAFIIGGLALFTSMIWDQIGSSSRVIITYGPGIIAFIMGILIIKDQKFQRASTPLFIISAALMPSGMFVFLNEYADGDNTRLAGLIVFAVVATQFLTTFYKIRRTSLLFFGYLFAITALGIAMDMSGIPDELWSIALSFSVLTFAFTIDKTIHRAIAPFYYFIGGIGFMWTWFDLLEGWAPLDILYLALSIYMMLLSVRFKSRTLLLVSTFSLLGYLGYLPANILLILQDGLLPLFYSAFY